MPKMNGTAGGRSGADKRDRRGRCARGRHKWRTDARRCAGVANVMAGGEVAKKLEKIDF